VCLVRIRVDVRMLDRKFAGVHVITSKQRPRKITAGRDGKGLRLSPEGHEDLRQDERVMQLFGLVRCFTDSGPADEEVRSEDSALCYFAALITVAWLAGVPNTGTLHSLLRLPGCEKIL
jgi:FKBP12-rapamycin complex-associated protein